MSPAKDVSNADIIRLKSGFTPFVISNAQTLPPNAKLPSAVMSAKFSILKVINTPSASTDQISPCENVDINICILNHSPVTSAIFSKSLVISIFNLSNNSSFKNNLILSEYSIGIF